MKKVHTIKEWVSKMRSEALKSPINTIFVHKNIWLKLADLLEQQERMINELTAIVNRFCEHKEKSKEWISCGKDFPFPKDGEVVYLTFKNSAGIHVGEATYKEESFYYVTDTIAGYYEEEYLNPIAWQPTPKPYRG